MAAVPICPPWSQPVYAGSFRTYKIAPCSTDRLKARRAPKKAARRLIFRSISSASLLVRIDREVNKDAELRPLVRWQFQGGLYEDRRRTSTGSRCAGARS